MPTLDRDQKTTQPVPLHAIATALLKVSVYGVGGGGGVVWAHRIAVGQCRWITEQEFADIVSLCQFMPGPNVIGIAVCVGAKVRGAHGALAAVAGFLVIPWIVGFILAVSLLQFAQHPVLRNALAGLSAAAAGLLIATGIKMLLPHRRRPAALVFAVLALALMVLTGLPLLAVLFMLVPLSVGVAAIEHARAW